MKISFKEVYINLPGFFIVVLTLLNLFLTTLPLTNTLGYEFSAINGILLFFFGGLVAISLLRKNGFKTSSFFELIEGNKGFILTAAAIPFLIGLVYSIVFSKCPVLDGVMFYLIISVPSFVFGMMIGFFSFALSKKFSFWIFLFLFFVILLSPLLEFYFNPQIYFYNPIFGFYPGTIYDEDLSVDRILVAYRIFNAAFFIGLVFMSERMFVKKLLSKIALCLCLLLIVIIFSILKPTLQFATDKHRLETNLNKSIITENFQIHFPDSLGKNEAEFAALIHEYYLDQIEITLNRNYKKKIDSYLFGNRNQKRELLGSGNADIAKPWLNQVYLNYTNFDATLKHELAHAVAGEFGTTPLKVAENFNPTMIEGLAMAIENNYDRFPLHYMAKLAYQAGYKFPIQKLFSGLNFFSGISSVSYIYAGSFIKFLAEQFGIERIKKLYGNSDFEQVFGKDLSTLSKEYDEFLKSHQIEFNRNKAQLYFGSVTIFKKFCPRMAASDVKEAWELFKEKKTDEALKLFKRVYNYSNSYQSLIGIITCYSKKKEYSEAEKLLGDQISNFKSSQYFFYLELILGDLLIQTNRQSEATAVYDSLLLQNPHIEYANEVLIRKIILDEGIDSLKNYFNKNEAQKYRKLLKLNEKEIKYFSIPTLIRSAEQTKLNMSETLNDLRKKIKVTDYTSSYAAMEISKYALRNSDYETAQDFAVRALDFKKDDNSNHALVENLRMVNWFKNFANDTKSTFRYRQ